MSIIFVITTAYTGYRRSIGDILESSSDTTSHKNKVVEVENHNNNKVTTTATIITQNTENNNATLPSSTSSSSSAGTIQKDSPNSNEAFIQNEKQAQVQAPQPAPRTRLSSQNSVPLTNGTAATIKSDDVAQVRYECIFLHLILGMFSASRYYRKEILF